MKIIIGFIIALVFSITTVSAEQTKETECRIYLDRFGVVKIDKDLYGCTNVVDNTVMVHKQKKIRYEIRWPDNLTDGEFYVAVQPGIIYMRGGHNNPNPNGFYWYQVISDEQYIKIAKYLDTVSSGRIKVSYRIKGSNWQYMDFSPLDVNESIIISEDRLNYLQKNRNRLMMNNLVFILYQLNGHCFFGKAVLTIQKNSFIARKTGVIITDQPLREDKGSH